MYRAPKRAFRSSGNSGYGGALGLAADKPDNGRHSASSTVTGFAAAGIEGDCARPGPYHAFWLALCASLPRNCGVGITLGDPGHLNARRALLPTTNTAVLHPIALCTMLDTCASTVMLDLNPISNPYRPLPHLAPSQ